jgi:lipopolysaccharide export system protein LptA
MSRPAKVAAPALALACLAAMLVAAPAGAASTDRQQPMSLDADNQDSLLTDDGRSLFRGNVRVQQGTLDIRADLGSVSYRGGEIAVIEFTGSPATLFQRQDDGTPLTVRANSITYDLQADRAVATGGVTIEQPRGTMSGERLVYDLKTGQVTGGLNDDGSPAGRVRLVLQPRAAAPAEAPAAPPAAPAEAD